MIRIALILILGSLALTSCRTPKTVVEEVKTEEQPTTIPDNEQQTYYLGEVQLVDCGPVIHVTIGEKRRIFAPTNLESKFHVDKLRLKLTFKVLPEKGITCSEFPAIELIEAFAVR